MPWVEYLLTVDWVTHEKTALSALVGAGVGSALVQGLFSLMEKRRHQTAHATYLAMRVAVLLDAFGLACSTLIDFNAMAEHHQEHEFPNWDLGSPSFHPILRISRDGCLSTGSWRAGACGFAARFSRARGVIYGTRDYSEYDLGDAIDEQAAHMGLKAWHLASDLHRRYSLDHAGGGYAASLEGVETGAIKAMRDRQERSATRRQRKHTPDVAPPSGTA
jgi:hypothetical protein